MTWREIVECDGCGTTYGKTTHMKETQDQFDYNEIMEKGEVVKTAKFGWDVVAYSVDLDPFMYTFDHYCVDCAEK